MKITEEQMLVAINAFTAALPEGVKFHVLATVPKVGFADTEAGCVRAIVMAEKDEEFDRFKQIINKGIEEYSNELGYSAQLLRQA
jgi:aspartate/methionine/tyrosine aminotransferase